ncbi:MAG TPA: F0F1 ATP synthase subunit alpha, partial [Candidatus Fimivivens sp.]|nr:F0F1 ATP synthase subunit alpha [Candidatus Fimivivens sp.]
VAGTLRLDLAQFRELEAFAQFGSDLDEKTRAQIERGRRSVEVLKQGQYSPMRVEEQVAVLYALSRGHLDTVPVEKIRSWEKEFLAYLTSEGEDALAAIREKKALDEETEALLKGRIEEFMKRN